MIALHYPIAFVLARITTPSFDWWVQGSSVPEPFWRLRKRKSQYGLYIATTVWNFPRPQSLPLISRFLRSQRAFAHLEAPSRAEPLAHFELIAQNLPLIWVFHRVQRIRLSFGSALAEPVMPIWKPLSPAEPLARSELPSTAEHATNLEALSLTETLPLVWKVPGAQRASLSFRTFVAQRLPLTWTFPHA
jgi:hypothetical protein